eukprot:TRINITY_DN2122_c0_g1_i2.p1 TRINITY_DN2122_c0_g1~~TRINITY_DN2122_c0_g1_i2.p1  ORF type:complete len:141 (+),score=31.15 TRINITY_DN2122_c0_g1_i2:119-541(+)
MSYGYKMENQKLLEMIQNERILIEELRKFNTRTKEEIKDVNKAKERIKLELCHSSKFIGAQEDKLKMMAASKDNFLHQVRSTRALSKKLQTGSTSNGRPSSPLSSSVGTQPTRMLSPKEARSPTTTTTNQGNNNITGANP